MLDANLPGLNLIILVMPKTSLREGPAPDQNTRIVNWLCEQSYSHVRVVLMHLLRHMCHELLLREASCLEVLQRERGETETFKVHLVVATCL